MKKIQWLVCVLGVFLFMPVWADDTDIYLDADGPRANPPYLMLMIDFTPDTGRSFCGPLSGCTGKFTENSFAKLCSLYAVPPAGNPKHTESACRLLYRQLTEGGLTTQSTAGF
jgi:hypothetical protein